MRRGAGRASPVPLPRHLAGAMIEPDQRIAAVLIWQFLTPSLATMKYLSPGRAGLILLRIIGLAIAVYSRWRMWLYVWRVFSTFLPYK